MGRHSLDGGRHSLGDSEEKPAAEFPRRRSAFSEERLRDTTSDFETTPVQQPVEAETKTEPADQVIDEEEELHDLVVWPRLSEEENSLAEQPGVAEEEAKPLPSSSKKTSLTVRLIGYLGELLITAGLVIALFIVWQVWWTDLLANRDQSERVASATQSWVQPEKIGTARTDEPPAVEHPTQIGEVEGILRIPRFGKDYAHTIEYGTGLRAVLNTGAYGQYEGTAYAGEVGNFALAAHRQTYGAALRDVQNLQIGDSIIVETEKAYYVYKVSESYIVPPEQVEVIAPVPNNPGATPTERKLTLTTCHPPFISDDRWIIHATYDHWVDRADGIPSELSQEN